MGTIKQVTYNLIGSSSNNGYDIYADLLSQKHPGTGNAEKYYISKIGIQAPPGSVFAFNADVEGSEIPIVMGKTGIYELEGVRIYKFKFLKQYELQQDEEATRAYEVAAQRHLAMADYVFDNYVLHDQNGNLQTDIVEQAKQLEIYMYGGENSPLLYYKPLYDSENNLIGFDITNQEQDGYEDEQYVGLERAKEELAIGNRGVYFQPPSAKVIDVSNVIVDYVEEGVE